MFFTYKYMEAFGLKSKLKDIPESPSSLDTILSSLVKLTSHKNDMLKSIKRYDSLIQKILTWKQVGRKSYLVSEECKIDFIEKLQVKKIEDKELLESIKSYNASLEK